MKFDNIIGNPPYNNDLYVEFMYKLNNVYADNMIVIVPAKLYFNKDTTTNKFKKLFQNIEKCIFYQCEGEVFKISMASGIAVLWSKPNIFKETDILNISNIFESFNTDEWYRIDKNIDTFNIKAISIIEKILKHNNRYKLSDNEIDRRYKCTIRKQAYVLGGSSNSARSIFYYDDKFDKGWVTNSLSIEEQAKVGIGRVTIFSSNNIEECESFVSYINTRLVRYLIAVGASGYSNIMNDETFRFVPKPDRFDHIFTDKELYEKYSLTCDEINIIESIIKER